MMRFPPGGKRMAKDLVGPILRCSITRNLPSALAKTMIWQPLPDELQARVAAEWGVEGLVEVVVVSGFYQMFATINQGFGIMAAPASPAR